VPIASVPYPPLTDTVEKGFLGIGQRGYEETIPRSASFGTSAIPRADSMGTRYYPLSVLSAIRAHFFDSIGLERTRRDRTRLVVSR
jgi:hypothetical protein